MPYLAALMRSLDAMLDKRMAVAAVTAAAEVCVQVLEVLCGHFWTLTALVVPCNRAAIPNTGNRDGQPEGGFSAITR
jgi:hypothetical protein